jgi:GNAT superfamily N-acetyltransferase
LAERRGGTLRHVDDLALVEAAAANDAAAFEVIARHATWPGAATRRFGSVVAIVTGHPSSAFWNPVLATAPGSQIVDALAAASWVRGHGVPCSMQVDPDRAEVGMARAVSALRLVADPWVSPVMAMPRIPRTPKPPDGLVVDEVRDAGALEDWLRSFARSDDVLERARRTFGPSVIDDPAIRLLAGRLDGGVVGTSIAVRSDRVVGVYAVGTEDAYRRRGIGTAMTWAAVEVGRRWRCRSAILQASEMGLPVYRAMGFTEIARYVEFEPAP